MSVLFEKQITFTRLLPKLLQYAQSNGYEVTLGDAFRDPRAFGTLGNVVSYGHPRSAHKQRLAIDLNLFKNGVFLQTTEDHRFLGEYWESLGGTWGGRFNDANHYSIEHDGIR